MIINRYISKACIKYVFLILGIVISLFVIIEYLSRTGSFIKQGMTLTQGFGFVLLKAPYVFSLVLPVACILAPIVAFGLMKRNNELVALQSGGISVYSLLKPVAVCGVLLGLLLFISADIIVPATITKAYEIQRKLRNKTVKTTRDNNIWLKDDHRILYITYYNAINKTLADLSVFEMGKAFELERRIDAKAALFKNGTWLLSNVLELRLNKETKDYDSVFYQEKQEDLGIIPDDLKRVVKYSEEMSIKELYQYVRKVELEGYDASYYKVDLYGKTAVPFACMFMAMMGAGIVLARKKKDAIATNIAMGTGIAFLFWFFNSFCVSLGYAGLLPAIFAAWMANLLFVCVCGIVLINAE
ncbi:MAG: LPS export ABC transporter permease LptG [Proteobacteria bacterium]|nr:LPS export ABC transporter permease LptG [Pseudomonadota bacterium]